MRAEEPLLSEQTQTIKKRRLKIILGKQRETPLRTRQVFISLLFTKRVLTEESLAGSVTVSTVELQFTNQKSFNGLRNSGTWPIRTYNNKSRREMDIGEDAELCGAF